MISGIVGYNWNLPIYLSKIICYNSSVAFLDLYESSFLFIFSFTHFFSTTYTFLGCKTHVTLASLGIYHTNLISESSSSFTAAKCIENFLTFTCDHHKLWPSQTSFVASPTIIPIPFKSITRRSRNNTRDKPPSDSTSSTLGRLF